MSSIARFIVSSFLVALAAGCVSVPGDAGIADVGRTVLERASHEVVWSETVSAAEDDPRVAGILESPLDADTAVAIALVNSPRVQVALAELGLARADLIEASTISNPVLGAEVRFPREPRRPFEWTVTESLIDLLTLRQRRRAGEAAFESAKASTTSAILLEAAETRDAFWGLLSTSRKADLTREIAESTRIATDLAQRQHAAGNISDLDLEMQQASYEQAKMDLAAIEAEERLRRETLARHMGLRDPLVPWSIVAEFPDLPAIETDDATLESLASARRLDLVAAMREAERARMALPLARAEAIGDIDIDIHLEREPEGVRTWGPGIDIPIPIFGRGRAVRARADAAFERAVRDLVSRTLIAGSEIRSARDRLSAARSRVEYFRDIVLPRRERILGLTQLAYNGMFVGIDRLLRARDELFDAKRRYVDVQHEYWIARNSMERALDGVGGDYVEDMDVTSAAMPRNARGEGGH